MLYGSDNGRTVWYFSAPSKYLGDQSRAIGGRLKFRLGHSEYMSNGRDMIKDWDVILESKEWRIRIGIKNLVPPWVGATNNDLSVDEKSWTVMKGQGHGHSPTAVQMIRLMSSLSAIYIRGGDNFLTSRYKMRLSSLFWMCAPVPVMVLFASFGLSTNNQIVDVIGYYDGHEETWLDSVLLEEGDHHLDALMRKVPKPPLNPKP